MAEVTYWTNHTLEFDCHRCGVHCTTVSRVAKYCDSCGAIREAEVQAKANAKRYKKRAASHHPLPE